MGEYFGLYQNTSGVESPLSRFAKNFFTEKNWLYQAFIIVKDLPSATGKRADNNIRGG